jgi:hypothetical protein
MAKKRADALIQSNKEYVKLRDSSTQDQPPRETPSQHAPGNSGHDLPNLERWTTVELRSHALRRRVPGAKDMSRRALIEALME